MLYHLIFLQAKFVLLNGSSCAFSQMNVNEVLVKEDYAIFEEPGELQGSAVFNASEILLTATYPLVNFVKFIFIIQSSRD